jgi:hypothetical protein
MEKKVRRCGNSFYTVYIQPQGNGYFVETKDLDWKVEPLPLSDANRLNGWEFKGVITLNYSASRRFYRDKDCWSSWDERDGYYNDDIGTYVEKRSGKWGAGYSPDYAVAPVCSAIPENRECS